MQGQVKFFNIRKGYGFIAGEDGNDYYLYFKNVQKKEPGYVVLRTGDKVQFDASTEVPEDGKCVTAVNVQLVE